MDGLPDIDGWWECGMLMGGRGYEIFFKWRGRFRNEGGYYTFVCVGLFICFCCVCMCLRYQVRVLTKSMSSV